MLTEALEKCQYCDKGLLGLANSCQDERPEGPIPILKVKCSNCWSINSIRPAESHRTGKRGSATLDINSRAGLGALHTGIGHSQYSGLMSTLGFPSLTSRNENEKLEVPLRVWPSGRVPRLLRWKGTSQRMTVKGKGQWRWACPTTWDGESVARAMIPHPEWGLQWG